MLNLIRTMMKMDSTDGSKMILGRISILFIPDNNKVTRDTNVNEKLDSIFKSFDVDKKVYDTHIKYIVKLDPDESNDKKNKEFLDKIEAMEGSITYFRIGKINEKISIYVVT